MREVGIRSRAHGWDGVCAAGALAVFAVVCLACGFGPPEDSITFAQPTLYVVQQGDDVARIARVHKVDVIEVLEWNNLVTDAPEVGTTVLIWPHGTVGASASAPVAGAPSGGARPRPRSAPRPGAPPSSSGEVVPVSTVDGGDPARPTTVRGAGLLGADDSSSDDASADLEGASSGMGRQRSTAGEARIGDNSALGSGGQAESLTVEQRRTEVSGPVVSDRPITPPRVAKPAAKKCLPPTASVVDENGISREAGLTTGQITSGMSAISRYTPMCFPSGTLGTYAMIVEVTVGCDGRVKNVYTVSPGAVPPNVTACIETTLSNAGFSAHAVPDGMSFQYPMKFRF